MATTTPSTTACPSLEELIRHHGLNNKDLRLVCPHHVRDKIALKLVDWKIAGRFFGLPREKLAAIERNNDTEEQRRVALLDAWGEREGKGATCFKLAEVLHQRERSDLVGLLCDAIKTLTTDAEAENVESSPRAVQHRDTAERIKTLEKEFDGLHQQLVSELTEGNICSRDELLRAVNMLPVSIRSEYQSLIQQKLRELLGSGTIFELLLYLSPLFTFIDCGLLDHLILKFGSSKLQNDMQTYMSKIQIFMQETTVADLIDYWPGGEDSHIHYSKLKAKFSDDPKTYTLERLNNFRRQFCSKVRLSDFIFGLIALEAGKSFFATWLVPTIVATELTKAISNIDESFYQMEHIVMISLNQTILYQVAKMPEIICTSSDTEVNEISDHKEVDTSISSHGLSASMTVVDISDKLQNEMKRLRTVMSDKDLEIQRLRDIVEEAETVHKPLIQSYTAKISEIVCDLVKFVQDKRDDSSTELEQMKTELQTLTTNLESAAEQIGQRETLTTAYKHQLVERWLSAASNDPPPSDSGLVTETTSVRSVDSGSSDIVDPICYNELTQAANSDMVVH